MPKRRITSHADECGKTDHGEEEIQCDQRRLRGVSEGETEALAQFRGQAERAE